MTLTMKKKWKTQWKEVKKYIKNIENDAMIDQVYSNVRSIKNHALSKWKK